MKRSYIKIIVFDIVLAIILILNSFILNILGNYYYMCAFLALVLIIFKLVFGFEKGRYRYTKDISQPIILIFMVLKLLLFL